MRATALRNWQLEYVELPDPTPGPGQVLTRVLACGICGSDLHLVRHGAAQQQLSIELEADLPPDPMRPKRLDPSRPVVMGHEFCCEVIEVGHDATNLRVGDIVVSMPGIYDANGVYALGFANEYPGGYAELMVLSDVLALKVPDGVTPRVAALTEPLAVGIHAVAKSRITQGDAAVVLGCGPVGLAVIAALRLVGIGPIVASDYSPARRRLAEQLGADHVVDPLDTSPITTWRAIDGMRPLVVFEAVGVPGMIETAMRMAPKDGRVLIVGACMEPDTFQPIIGIGREHTLQFALAYEPTEFAAALNAIASGRVDLEPLITGSVSVEGVAEAFAELTNPDRHAKILVEPARYPGVHG